MADSQAAVTLSPGASYANDGFVMLEDLFAADEVATLRAAATRALASRSERTIYEIDGATVRSIYGIHANEPAFDLLARHPRLVEVARDVLGGDVYVYQSKLNTKAVFGGDLWPWHQDYIYWRDEDGMPAPRAVTAAVFLDDVTEINGPMSLIPGSHLEGVIAFDTYDGRPDGYQHAPAWIANVVARLKYTLQKPAFVRLAVTNGVVTPKGRAGSALFFDCNTAHASPINMSPRERTLALFTYNRVDNAPPAQRLVRPEFLAGRDTRPIVAADDDALAAGKRASNG